MVTVNQNYLKLPGSYLFSNIAKKVSAYKEANPEFKDSVISLGIGDVTQPLAPAIIDALHKSVDEMAHAETFHGYAPDLGYEFLRSAIAKNDYQSRGCDISADEIFVSDGAKSDSGNIQEIFGLDNKVAVCDPVYPVYVDTNVMAGRTGLYNKERENFDGVIYMPCKEENGFLPEIPADEVPDLIYLCFPNNPTGGAITKAALQEWVDYANKNGCVIIYDAAYEAYISEEDVPHSIYECEGARTCAIELRSFSKNVTECGHHCGGHVPADMLLVELLDEQNNPVPEGQEGEVVITTLGVRGMPLLRFKTGDICIARTGLGKNRTAFGRREEPDVRSGPQNLMRSGLPADRAGSFRPQRRRVIHSFAERTTTSQFPGILHAPHNRSGLCFRRDRDQPARNGLRPEHKRHHGVYRESRSRHLACRQRISPKPGGTDHTGGNRNVDVQLPDRLERTVGTAFRPRPLHQAGNRL